MIDYSILQVFEIIATPVSNDGDLRVSMTAVLADVPDSPMYYAGAGLWEDNYLYHLQHTAGLEPELAAKATERLNSGTFVRFRVTCFPEELQNVGFAGVQRG
jgi:hypothetical protein